MRKKVLTAILPVCVAMVMTACGGNADTAEVKETTATEESAEADAQEEADAQIEAEAEEQEGAVESEPTENEASADEESSEEIESGDDGTVNGDEFPIIGQAVIDNDKSDEYGVYSTSCFDLDEFLDEEGKLPGTEDYENTDWNTYTGRWAYPEITPCKLFDNLKLVERSDKEETFFTDDYRTRITISSGLWYYNYWDQSANDAGYTPSYTGVYKYMFTAQTDDGEVDVLRMIFKTTTYDGDVNLDDLDNAEGIDMASYSYLFTVGNFTVEIFMPESNADNPIELSEDDLQLIIDNIHLTDGIEER